MKKFFDLDFNIYIVQQLNLISVSRFFVIVQLFKMLFIGWITGIIVAGGYESPVVDFLTGDLGIKQLPYLPQGIDGSSMVSHFGTILLCGGFGNEKKCLQLDHGTWKEHSILNVE